MIKGLRQIPALLSGSLLVFALISLISASAPDVSRRESPAVLPGPPTTPITFTSPVTAFLPGICEMKPVWHDEFDGVGSLDAENWICDVGTGYPGGPPQWGTGEVEAMRCSTADVFQSGGYLHIRALHSGTDPVAGWTSGRVETVRADFQPSVGGHMAIEARIRLPDVTGAEAQGYWPAFWLLGAPYRGNYWNWPGVGEVDIMENVNGLNQWWGALHCGTSPGGPCHEPTGLAGSASGFSPSLQSDFHTYRIEFDRSVSPEQIRWYVDGVQRHSVYASQVDVATWSNATEHGFLVILNVAIGGGWPGNPTSSTASGGTMLVDYVRVYARP